MVLRLAWFLLGIAGGCFAGSLIVLAFGVSWWDYYLAAGGVAAFASFILAMIGWSHRPKPLWPPRQ